MKMLMETLGQQSPIACSSPTKWWAPFIGFRIWIWWLDWLAPRAKLSYDLVLFLVGDSPAPAKYLAAHRQGIDEVLGGWEAYVLVPESPDLQGDYVGVDRFVHVGSTKTHFPSVPFRWNLYKMVSWFDKTFIRTLSKLRRLTQTMSSRCVYLVMEQRAIATCLTRSVSLSKSSNNQTWSTTLFQESKWESILVNYDPTWSRNFIIAVLGKQKFELISMVLPLAGSSTSSTMDTRIMLHGSSRHSLGNTVDLFGEISHVFDLWGPLQVILHECHLLQRSVPNKDFGDHSLEFQSAE